MSEADGANRIELECQILCSALRLSLAESDVPGILKTCQELYQLFPDLLPPAETDNTENFYNLLSIESDVNPSMVLAAYFRSLKRFLRDNPEPEKNKEAYFKILNAGYVLRKPRLRMSHDLIVAREHLAKHKVIPKDGTLEMIDPSGEISFEPRGKRTDITKPKLPRMIELMKAGQFIGPEEARALMNQMEIYPDISLEDLVLRAGYLTEPELKSIQLAEYLMSQGKIGMGQFSVPRFEERSKFNMYKKDLAYIQQQAYSHSSREIASYLARIFKNNQHPIEHIIDIGCGAGYSSQVFAEAGFQVTAIEPSVSLAKMTRQNAPLANVINQSAYNTDFPPCDAVVAIGEPLTYHSKDTDAIENLRKLFENLSEALPAGGLFIFDLIITGKNYLSKLDWQTGEGWALFLEAVEDKASKTLTRKITTFRRAGENYRRAYEVHHVRLFDQEVIEKLLTDAGFAVEVDTTYGFIDLPTRRMVFTAVRQ